MTPDQPPPAYLRHPTIQGDDIVFVADDDLWRVAATGGTAQRLTAGLSEPSTPCLSGDGRWIAFTGRDEQHAEVWLMPAAGGPARRLTWLGCDVAVRGFMPDGRVLFCSNHGQPFLRNWHAWVVSPEGGLPERLPLGQVQHLAINGKGRRLIGRNTIDPARWKRYRGGTAGHLWVEDESGGSFTRLAGLAGNLTSPMWLGNRVYFLGDHEGVGNLYSCRADGSELRRHSDHADFYARHASTDGRRIVYQCGAELWIYSPAQDTSTRLDVRVPSARTQASRRFVAAADHLQGMAMHPAGHSLALESRGQIFTMALWEGAVRHLGGGTGRRRLAQWLADGERLVGTSDADGEEKLELHGADGARTLPWPDLGRITALRAAPEGRRIALCNHRNEIWVGDVDEAAPSRVDHSEFGRIEDPVWSPCGGWLAYSTPTSTRHRAIKLFELASRRAVFATEPEFRDWSPAFDPAGRYLYFLSLRTFDPVYDAVQFELSFPRAARPYLVALQGSGPPPFEPQPKGMKAGEGGRRAGDDKAAVPAIEPEGLARRVAAFPVPEGRFGRLAAVSDGKVVWTTLPIAGAHGRGGHKDGPGRIEVFDFATSEVKTLVAQASDFVLAGDHRTLLARSGKKLRVVDAAKPPEDKPAAADQSPSRKSGFIDVGRVRLSVEPAREWAQILREVWRLQRDHFWVPDMSGVDWQGMYDRYAPLLQRVSTRGELSDLIWELQGELGTSHAYEMGGDHRQPPSVAMGHLAVDLKAVEGGWEIVRTVRGDPWDAAADSPLNAVGVSAQAGERIVAVGGQAVTAAEPPQALLVHQAAAKVSLTLASPAGVEPPRRREVLVTTLADETAARYREWVERNRARVHEASGGRVGYFHLPDMMSAGFAEFHRYFPTECDRDALIVDVRYNRGGHVSQLLLEKVARRRIAWNTQRWGRPDSYPEEAPAGTVVALTNEHAGSDGDIFSHGFKLMRVGTLVGKRTWGGVIGINPRHTLIDGTTTTQPEYSFWFKDVGFAVENYGTDPDIEIDNAPQDDAFNAPERDRQLAAALTAALDGIERVGVFKPDFSRRPRLTPAPLPPRAG